MVLLSCHQTGVRVGEYLLIPLLDDVDDTLLFLS